MQDDITPHPYRVVHGAQVSETMHRQAKRMRKTMTQAESILWNSLRANRLLGLRFRRQQVIDAYIVDFYCHAASLIIEVDGDVHEQQQEYDEYRDLKLRSLGFQILRFSNEEVFQNLPQVLARIEQACKP